VEGQPLPTTGAHAVTELLTANGPADYALTIDGRILGIVEAKKVTLGPAGVLVQAERYSKGVADSPFSFRGFRVPFLYSTNGEILYFHDVRDPLNTSRRTKQFHTPAALQELLDRDDSAACARLAASPDNHPRLRPYQIEANKAAEEAIAQRKRALMLAMATGCGKTFTLVNQIYRLMKAGVAKRVLFLVDRRALAAQAVRAFSSFEPEPNQKFDAIYEVYSQRFRREDLEEDEKYDPKVLPREYLTDPQPKHTFLYVSTIQRMAINLFGRSAVWSGEGDDIDDEAEQLDIPIHAFDLIVADECHRGYTPADQSVWRNTLDHFDAIKIGLTATPAPHTLAYFQHKAFDYPYARAVREGFLVDYDIVKLKSDVRLAGLHLAEGENVQYVDPETGNTDRFDRIEDARDYTPGELEKLVTSPDSNRKVIEELKKYTDAHEAKYGRFPKTLIFGLHDQPHISHADQLVETARDVYGRGEGFVRKITGRSDRPLQLIREFRNRPQPGVVVSVDLMSTGVDIPDLEFIVFLRPVRSRILFEQMLGRGTRKGEKAQDKSHFVVVDCFDGMLVKAFRDKSMMVNDRPDEPTRPIAEIIEDIWANRDRPYNVRCLVRRLQRIDKEMHGDARADFAAFGIPDGDVGKYAAGLSKALDADFAKEMERLRNKAFQKLLIAYKRKDKSFTKALDNVDTVSSDYLFGDAEGKEYKPADYLEQFARFVRDNPNQIEAIRILLDRPKGWGTTALKELKEKLSTAPERFTPDRLEAAHRAHYRRELVDIISMVKHAAKEGEPLLTAGERVDRAFAKLTAGRTFTPAQQAWLDRIRQHLVTNLSIDRDDFENLPILADPGGWGSANKAFGGQLSEFLLSLNEAVAA
jgi:type I restriction enzyme, R subunit